MGIARAVAPTQRNGRGRHLRSSCDQHETKSEHVPPCRFSARRRREETFERLVEMSTLPGELVVDPFWALGLLPKPASRLDGGSSVPTRILEPSLTRAQKAPSGRRQRRVRQDGARPGGRRAQDDRLTCWPWQSNLTDQLSTERALKLSWLEASILRSSRLRGSKFTKSSVLTRWLMPTSN